MFDFLSKRKNRILLVYPFVRIFLEDTSKFREFLRDLNIFESELITEYGFTPEEIEKIKLVAKISSSELIYNKKEPLPIAVKRYHVLANEVKKKFPKYGEGGVKDQHIGLSREEFVALYRKTYAEVAAFSEQRLDSLMVDMEVPGRKVLPERLERLKNTKRWAVEVIDIKDIGVWPCFGGVDHIFTTGNLADTVKQIRRSEHKLPEKISVKLQSIMSYADIIYRLFPIILTQKGRETRRIQANRYLRENNPTIRYLETKYDVMDGSHRAVAYALTGIKKIKCFVGYGLEKDTLPLSVCPR